ncbi:MAG: TolC family protein, partial [Candidatus Xenobia bacterium]
ASGSLGVSQQIIETPSWAVGLNLGIPLLDGQSTHDQIQLATASLKVAQSQAESERNLIYEQVEQDVLALRASTTQMQVAQQGVAYAAQSLDLANGRYKAGFGSSLDYLDAVVALSQARSSLLTAEVAYRVAEANLNRALGRDAWK